MLVLKHKVGMVLIFVQISSTSAEGHSGSYRFMLADVINPQLKSVTMKEIPGT